MNVVLIIAAVSLLISIYYIRAFLLHYNKIKALAAEGIDTQGLLFEVRNLGLQQNTASRLSEIAVKFATGDGKDHIVRYKKELQEGEIIAVGSQVALTYLATDPSICSIPSLGLTAQNKWIALTTGVVVLVLGLFIAYIVFINIGTV